MRVEKVHGRYCPVVLVEHRIRGDEERENEEREHKSLSSESEVCEGVGGEERGEDSEDGGFNACHHRIHEIDGEVLLRQGLPPVFPYGRGRQDSQ